MLLARRGEVPMATATAMCLVSSPRDVTSDYPQIGLHANGIYDTSVPWKSQQRTVTITLALIRGASRQWARLFHVPLCLAPAGRTGCCFASRLHRNFALRDSVGCCSAAGRFASMSLLPLLVADDLDLCTLHTPVLEDPNLELGRRIVVLQ